LPTLRKEKSKKVTLLVGLVLWQIYILIIGKSGILQDFSLPPRVLIFLVFPAFLFTAVFLNFKQKQGVDP
jgi:hypothetical protein